MRLFLLFSLLVLMPGFAFSQSQNDSCTCNAESTTSSPDTDAQFPGGNGELLRRFREVKFESKEVEEISSKVYLQMIIDENGKVVCACVRRTTGSRSFDQQFVDVAMALPNFIPARQNGKAVAQVFNLSIIIHLH